ncbi:PREDICTED: translation initiation factor eIF-2B subunit delta isoform X2 [Papilio xuthus]|nr:PREDICTED: translation initiation factor eIF-2B subunit delta isoform X2 [Papilio xuthus]
MSSNDMSMKSKEEVLAAREAKKLSKQKAKKKDENQQNIKVTDSKPANEKGKAEPEGATDLSKSKPETKSVNKDQKVSSEKTITKKLPKGKDEVDRAVKEVTISLEKTELKAKDSSKDNVITEPELNVKKNETENVQTKEQIRAERAAKKAAKQAKKKGGDNIEKDINKNSLVSNQVPLGNEITNVGELNADQENNSDGLTVGEVVKTLKDIVNVAKEFQAVTDKVKAIDLTGNKSKAELRAERRAKQEAQRAAKQAQQKPAEKSADSEEKEVKKQNVPAKLKTAEKAKTKTQMMHRANWFQHLYTEHDKEALKKIALNSNLHPAVIKLGVQLASQVVTGSNARCIALLNALKKMVRDYTLPAKTEFARGLESHLAASLDFLWAMRQPSASQTNAVKHFRRQLMQLPNNLDEFHAKKSLEEDIDRYIREQIDMAGEAISIAVRNKISHGDNIMTYGCSSLIERILCEAWESGVRFRAVVVGDRVRRGAREMLRRLAACGLPCTYADISAVSFLMRNISKVVMGAGALLASGSVLGPLGSAQVALAARGRNVPVLVACETHKFSERVQTDAFVYNEIGDPDDLIDKTDENSPLKDWRSNPNLTLLNLTYDVTPPSLVTAVVTELAILPCTSAPVVLRIKPSEYSPLG